LPKLLQVTRHQRLKNHGFPQKNVLTAKKGRFWRVLAGKQGFGRGGKTLYFATFHVFMVFFICMSLAGRIFRNIRPRKKNRAKKPTVGFSFSGCSGNIVA
jgi:hypothetical protein